MYSCNNYIVLEKLYFHNLDLKQSIYTIYEMHIMVKTLRISDENHKEMLKVQGQIQAKSGEFTSMDDVIAKLIKKYHSKK